MNEKVKELLFQILEVDDEKLLDRKVNAEWDSIKHLELIMEIEEEFDVRFSSNEVASIKNMDSIITLLKSK